ncbi:hypothetical protein CWI37_1206p0010 [Hamiltosporidium tvaerminnensis]|uniref:Uncharacterized protein n=2 Tax=Hamiltosporidium tvaerminnensis TaxID=1176355 RepID=A0A4Q9KYT1_9MICR|nr:hypothetical protein LUQ84_001433 [Hamiltosporidium tvaerminnensis]TBT99814.1 hypothetical protein CWI37_1206p0010 [Hamiltosporidium tvaerminnensis]
MSYFTRIIVLKLLINYGNFAFLATFSENISSISFFTTNKKNCEKNEAFCFEEYENQILNYLNDKNKLLLNNYIPENMPIIWKQECIYDVKNGFIDLLEAVFAKTDICLFAENMKEKTKILGFILGIRDKYFRCMIEQKFSLLLENLSQIKFETKNDSQSEKNHKEINSLGVASKNKKKFKRSDMKVQVEECIECDPLLTESIDIFARILTDLEFILLIFCFDGFFEQVFQYLNIDFGKVNRTCLCESESNWVTGFFNKKSIFNILKGAEKKIHGASNGSNCIDLLNEECEIRYFTFCSQLNMFFDCLVYDNLKVFEKHFFDLFICKTISIPEFSKHEIIIYINFFYQEKVLKIGLTNISLKNGDLYLQIKLDNFSSNKQILNRFSEKILSIPNDYLKFNLIFIDISFFRNSCLISVKENFDVSWSQHNNDLSSVFNIKSLTFNQYLNFLRSLKLEIYRLQSKYLRFKIIIVEENILNQAKLAEILHMVLNKYIKSTVKYSKTSITDDLTISRIKKLLYNTQTDYNIYNEYLNLNDSLKEALSKLFSEFFYNKSIEVVFCDRNNDDSFDTEKIMSLIKNSQ